MEEDRDDVSMRHFKRRSAQTRIISSVPVVIHVPVRVEYESGFGGVSSEIDDIRFIKRRGTEDFNTTRERNTKMNCMRGFLGA